MLTLRVIPPRLFFAGGSPEPRDLTALYFDALWRRWSLGDRALALALAGLGAAFNAAAARGSREAWRNGWDAAEEALLEGARDRAAHLSMAARKGLHRLINPGAYPLDKNPLKNKRLFHESCRGAGLPAPDAFEGGDLAAWLGGEAAVIVKPNYASKGFGIVAYRRASGGWLGESGAMTDADVVRAVSAALARGAVVQRACKTHPDLEDVSPGALPTLRVMTAVNETGAIEACDRVLRFSAGGPRPVDNFNAANFVAGLDPEGRITRAWRRAGGAIETATTHPATGVALTGRRVPDLGAAIALARRAHKVFADGFRIVGWDVGMTADGPVLIEGNWNPGTDILQLVSGRGVGDGRLGELYRLHLARAARSAARPIEREPRR